MFRTVGLIGEGEIGRGDLRAWLVVEMGTARASFGLAARASMLMVCRDVKGDEYVWFSVASGHTEGYDCEQ